MLYVIVAERRELFCVGFSAFRASIQFCPILLTGRGNGNFTLVPDMLVYHNKRIAVRKRIGLRGGAFVTVDHRLRGDRVFFDLCVPVQNAERDIHIIPVGESAGRNAFHGGRDRDINLGTRNRTERARADPRNAAVRRDHGVFAVQQQRAGRRFDEAVVLRMIYGVLFGHRDRFKVGTVKERIIPDFGYGRRNRDRRKHIAVRKSIVRDTLNTLRNINRLDF